MTIQIAPDQTELAGNLTEALERISGEGQISGDSESEVDEYSASVTVGVTATTVPHALADSLRSMGYAVVILSPSEVEGIDRGKLEEYLVSTGNDYIDLLKGRDDGQDC